METLQIRLSEKQVRRIDEAVRKGTYKSRSEVIRDAMERMEFLAALNELGDIIREENVSKEELFRELGKIRKEIYKKYL